MRIIRLAELVETPWKNGGGVTRYIASRDDDSRTLWRLSMADVAMAGPFSDFAGLTRILTVIEGDGMVLHGAGGDLAADYATPVVFDGATPITSELTKGPVRDFNLMFDTARCSGDAVVLRGPESPQFGDADTTGVVHCIAGKALVGDEMLDPGDTAIFSGPVQLTLEQGSIALYITLRARTQSVSG